MLLKIKCEYCDNENLEETTCDTTFYCPNCADEISIHECEVDVVKNEGLIDKDSISNFSDYLIENAGYAFEHQDRELLEKVLRDYNRSE